MRIFLIMIAACLSGCTANGQHSYVAGRCVTCLNNPFTGGALNYDKDDPKHVASQQIMMRDEVDNRPARFGEAMISVPIDIDTAYTRVKREFGYLTKKEWVKRNVMWDEYFQWEALPGVSYHMRDFIAHTYLGVTREQYIDVQLHKNGDLTDIQFQYGVKGSKVSISGFGESLKARALKALGIRRL